MPSTQSYVYGRLERPHLRLQSLSSQNSGQSVDGLCRQNDRGSLVVDMSRNQSLRRLPRRLRLNKCPACVGISTSITRCRLWRWITMGSLGLTMCETKSGRRVRVIILLFVNIAKFVFKNTQSSHLFPRTCTNNFDELLIFSFCLWSFYNASLKSLLDPVC